MIFGRTILRVSCVKLINLINTWAVAYILNIKLITHADGHRSPWVTYCISLSVSHPENKIDNILLQGYNDDKRFDSFSNMFYISVCLCWNLCWHTKPYPNDFCFIMFEYVFISLGCLSRQILSIDSVGFICFVFGEGEIPIDVPTQSLEIKNNAWFYCE